MILIDTEMAALMLGWTPNRFRVYVHRHPGEIPRRGKGEKGRAMYAYHDVESLAQSLLAEAA